MQAKHREKRESEELRRFKPRHFVVMRNISYLNVNLYDNKPMELSKLAEELSLYILI